MAQRQSHERAPKQSLRALEEAERMLRFYCDPTNTRRCAVDAEAREASRIYLDTWVGGPLRATIDYLHGRTREVGWESEHFDSDR